MFSFFVIPAQAGQKHLRVERPQGRPEGRAQRVIQGVTHECGFWIPACAGMTVVWA
jgi:hypothetical protein